jgi:fatty acid synthase subunit alpha
MVISCALEFFRPQVTAVTSLSSDKIPLLHLKRKVGNTWEYSSNLTGVYLDILHEIATSGLGTTFKDKNALFTGVGKGSIGVEVVKGLLSGGAHFIIMTSSIRLLNTTNQSSSLLAVAARLSLSFLSTRPRNRMLKLS